MNAIFVSIVWDLLRPGDNACWKQAQTDCNVAKPVSAMVLCIVCHQPSSLLDVDPGEEEYLPDLP